MLFCAPSPAMSGQLPSSGPLPVKANSHRHARHDTDRTVSSCPVWRRELSRTARQVRSISGLHRSVSSGAVRPPDDAERTCPAVNSHSHTKQDKTVTPACRPPPRRRPGRQLRPAARPPTRSDVVRRENVNTMWTVAYN